MNRSRQLLFLLLFVALLAPAGSQQAGVPPVTLSGKVMGASGKHPVYVALWSSAGFLVKPVQQIRIEPGSDSSFYFRVAPGAWALSGYEGVNENGKLDMGMFGPKEPSGFWHPFHAWRRPRFSDVSFTANSDQAQADIDLH